ncbi:MAG: DNA methyltransferase [Candidatus Limnocylindrales bacterium]
MTVAARSEAMRRSSPAPAAGPGAPSPDGLRPPVPLFPLELEWKAQPRLWGPSLHPMCTYLAAFPAGLPHALIARYTRPGDVVLDPFSGRGTTPLQACAEGRVGVGNDLSPLAYLLTAAKVDPPQPAELAGRLGELRARWTDQATSPASAPDVPAEVAVCFHPRTLAQLRFLRSSISLSDRTDRFLAAAVAGILHGRGHGFLSGVMPNAFSLPSAYVCRYARAVGFHAESRDLFDLLEMKIRRLLRDPLPSMRGIALLGDARDAGSRTRRALKGHSLPDRVRLVVTSPPYLRVVHYGASNWLRLWFLGLDPQALDARLDHAHRTEAWLRFLRETLADLQGALSDDAVVVLVLGDVESDGGHRLGRHIDLAALAWEAAAEPEGYRLAGIAADHVAAHRKTTRIWGDRAGRATRVDRILAISPTELGRRRELAGAALPIDWTWPPPARGWALRAADRDRSAPVAPSPRRAP